MIIHRGSCLQPVMESPSGRPSTWSATDTDLPMSSSTSGATLFQLMDIKSERQDRSYVEKIILPREQIISFCRALNAEVTKESQEEALGISFEELDRTSLNVIGFYGSKDLLIECLSCSSTIAANDPVYGKMRDDVLLPGLYALLSIDKRTLFVFYWHQGRLFPSASRKDSCCNFVRYLVDLCDTVFILLEGSEESISERLQKRLSSRPRGVKRKHELRIERVQATKNTVEFFPGFSIPLKIDIPGSSSDHDLATKFEYVNELQICGGSRCGISTRMLAPPRRFWRPQEVSVRLQETSTGLALFGGKAIDFTFEGLEVEDLSIFLQCSGCPLGKVYLGLLEKQRQRKDDFAKTNGSDREQRLMKYEEMVQKAMTDFISEYLKAAQVFSWDEAILTDASLEVEVLRGMLPDSQESTQHGASQKHPGNLLVNRGRKLVGQFLWKISEWRDSLTGSRARFGSLDKLESAIFTGFGKFTEIPNRFIFASNIVTIEPFNCKDHGRTHDQIYAIEYVADANGTPEGKHNPLGPLFHKDHLILRPIRSRQQQSKKVIFSAKDGMSDGPLLTNTHVYDGSNGTRGAECILNVVDDEFSFGGLQKWVASEADRILPQLRKKASLVTYVVGVHGPLPAEFIQQVLRLPDNEFLQALLRDHPAEVAHQVRTRWEEICAGTTPIPLNDVVVRRQCKIVYGRAREELFSTFQLWFKRYMRRLLQIWIQLEEDQNQKAFEEDLEKERRKFLRSLQQSPALSYSNQSGIKLRSCYITDSSGEQKSNVLVSDLLADVQLRESLLVVTYEEESSEMETEKWLVQEVSLSKDDLEEFERDPNHSFTPELQVPHQVLSLDPFTQKLLRLAPLKTDQYLAFVLSIIADVNQCQIFLIPTPGRQIPVRTFKHGYDLIAFDDQTRFLALYDQDRALVRIYRFEETYKQLEFCGAEVYLPELGLGSITWMKFIPGKAELLLIDPSHKVHIFDITAGIVRGSGIQLPGPFLRAEVTRQGPCLLVFSEAVTPLESRSRGNVASRPLQMEVYWIDQSMAQVRTCTTMATPTSLEDALVGLRSDIALQTFGSRSQEHILVFIDSKHKRLESQGLRITSASEEYQLLSTDGTGRALASEVEEPQEHNCGLALDYLYHVYEKFATNPPLGKQHRALTLIVVLNSDNQSVKEECVKYLDSTFNKLQTEKGKNFHRLTKQCYAHGLREVPVVLADLTSSADGSRKHIFGTSPRAMGGWIRQLLCLVPIQIVRAENNHVQPLADGLELSANLDYHDTVSLAGVLRFGFYDTVFASWRNKPVKIISSMGKQSSGKSYLLNHLSGSLLDVSGGRCTDGVWMTLRFDDADEDNACMYVLLDFEGIGTFERSGQEDMLLSVLNAAISNMTIYNKRDFNIDRETESIFERLQSGVSLVKADDKLFRGIFCIAVKDVGEADLDALDNELRVKIQKMLVNSEENFLTKMYGGRVIFTLMAPFNTANFYADIDQIYHTISDRQVAALYMDGRSFCTDLKLLIAQLCTMDLSSVDSNRMELRVSLLRSHLNSAVSMGRPALTKGNEVTLVNYDTFDEIADEALHLNGDIFPVNDTGLMLKSSHGDPIESIITSLKGRFQKVVQRDGEDDETWHTRFVGFLEGVTDRRKQRVMEWISSNTQAFQQHDHEAIQMLNLEAAALCAELTRQLGLCSYTCKNCFLRCTKEKSHADDHCCLGSHLCTHSCAYCVMEKGADSEGSANKCANVAGHQGIHKCRVKRHSCTQICEYYGKAANCNEKCAGTVGHEGQHLCNSREHRCSKGCSLHSCANPCILPFDRELINHSRHACHEKFCPRSCCMKGCNRRCESKDHFHGDIPNVQHFCGQPHPCLEKCEAPGNCVLQQPSESLERAYGKEQSDVRKLCCKEIPPFQTEHEGPHLHSLVENIVHFCDRKSLTCGHFCSEPYGHLSHHSTMGTCTVHGEMRDSTSSSGQFCSEPYGHLSHHSTMDTCTVHGEMRDSTSSSGKKEKMFLRSIKSFFLCRKF